MDRREFIVRIGSLALILPAGSLVPRALIAAGAQLTFTSSRDAGHTHTLSLAQQLITSPPEGGTSQRTSVDQGHAHTVRLSEQQLRAMAAGQVVEERTSVVAGHAHTFTFRLAGQQAS